MSESTTRQTSILRVVPWVTAWLLLAVGYFAATSGVTFDLRADRLTALAALDGVDPFVPIVELAGLYGSELAWTHVHPRTPGALLLQMPLTLVSEQSLRLVSAVMTSGALVATVAVAMRLQRLRPVLGLVVALGFGMTSVAVESAAVGAQSPLVAMLLALAWWRTRNGDDWWAGLSVGVALSLKLFPWLIFLLLAVKRRSTALVAVGSAGVLNGLGVLFGGVSISGTVAALTSTSWAESSLLNGSLARVVGGAVSPAVLAVVLAAVGTVFVVTIVRSRRSFDRQWFAVLAISLAASPLIWRHYVLVLVPAGIWLVMRGGTLGKGVGGALVIWLFLPYPLVAAWLTVPLCLAIALVAAASDSTQTEPGRVLDSGS